MAIYIRIDLHNWGWLYLVLISLSPSVIMATFGIYVLIARKSDNF